MKPLKGKSTKDDLGLIPYKPTSQDWPAYNGAQTNEKLWFKRLAADLLQVVGEEKKSSRGPKGHGIRTRLFSLLLQTYMEKSSRRIVSELKEAKRQGLIEKAPHFNTILSFYDDPDLPELLNQLISITALPLKQVEQDFTVDASGFSTYVYDEWNRAKNENPGSRRFKKAHVMSGVKTNVITAVNVTRGPAADSPEFIPLLRRTGKYFVVREISADMAYSSRKNLLEVQNHGGIPYIPFRKNVTGKSRGALIWRRMHEYFRQHREEFMQHYHKRSNAETVFAMLKRKLGARLRTRKCVSQMNEILLKCLAHNIIVLIHEMYELGIEVDFNYCAGRVFAQR